MPQEKEIKEKMTEDWEKEFEDVVGYGEEIKDFIRQLLEVEKQKVAKEEFHRGWNNCEKFWSFKITKKQNENF